MKFILLPGLHGTNDLFDVFVKAAPSSFRLVSINLDAYPRFDYPSVIEWITSQLPNEAYYIIAESYSGPIALSIAANEDDNLKGVVLVGSFAKSPLPAISKLIPNLFFKVIFPFYRIARFLLLSSYGDAVLKKQVINTLKKLKIPAYLGRVNAILNVNKVDLLTLINCKVLYLKPTHDLLVGKHSSQLIQKHVKHFNQVEIKGPHMLLQTKPSQCWRAIENWIA